jgi:hypothetical protein
MYFRLLCLLVLLTHTLSAQELPPKPAYPFGIKQIHSGHSLTDPLFYPHWPGQYVNLMSSVTGIPAWQLSNVTIGKSTAPGSSMMYRWDNKISNGAPDARLDIANWEVLSITEVVPLAVEGGNTQSWYLNRLQQQRTYLSNFVNNAWSNGNGGKGAPTLLWTTWTSIDGKDGPFREMLDSQGKEWEAMQEYANKNRPAGAPPVYIIPGHKMMARIYDDIQKGIVPGISDIKQLFSDNIHTNELGAYAIAMIHYACMFNKSPIGLPNQLIPNPPANTPIPTPEFAGYVQRMVWEVVTTYPRSGIQQLSTKYEERTHTFNIQQYGNHIYVNGIDNDVVQIDIYDIRGILKYRSMLHHDTCINLEFLPNGLYSIQINGMNHPGKHTLLVQLVGK